MKSHNNLLNRRNFIKGGASTVVATSLLSTPALASDKVRWNQESKFLKWRLWRLLNCASCSNFFLFP